MLPIPSTSRNRTCIPSIRYPRLTTIAAVILVVACVYHARSYSPNHLHAPSIERLALDLSTVVDETAAKDFDEYHVQTDSDTVTAVGIGQAASASEHADDSMTEQEDIIAQTFAEGNLVKEIDIADKEEALDTDGLANGLHIADKEGQVDEDSTVEDMEIVEKDQLVGDAVENIDPAEKEETLDPDFSIENMNTTEKEAMLQDETVDTAEKEETIQGEHIPHDIHPVDKEVLEADASDMDSHHSEQEETLERETVEDALDISEKEQDSEEATISDEIAAVEKDDIVEDDSITDELSPADKEDLSEEVADSERLDIADKGEVVDDAIEKEAVEHMETSDKTDDVDVGISSITDEESVDTAEKLVTDSSVDAGTGTTTEEELLDGDKFPARSIVEEDEDALTADDEDVDASIERAVLKLSAEAKKSVLDMGGELAEHDAAMQTINEDAEDATGDYDMPH